MSISQPLKNQPAKLLRNGIFFLLPVFLTPFLMPMGVASADTLLEEVIVTTGTKTERKLLDVPVRTEVVTKKELNNTHARDLAEGLKHVPGLFLKRIHGKSGQEVWVHGLDADRVLVLVDGMPVSASTGSSVDLTQISVGDVEHIEVVKGAVSALYGSEAMGGVVNVITKKPSKPFSYSLVLDTGSYGDKNSGDNFNDKHVKLDLGKNIKNWNLRFAADVRDKQGTDINKSTWSFEGDAGTKSNFSTQVGYKTNTGTEVTFKPSYYKEDITRNFSSYVPGVGEVRKQKNEVATRKNISAAFKKPFKNGSKLSGWYISEVFNDSSQQDTVLTPEIDLSRDAELKFDKAEIQWDQPIGEKHLFTVGLVGHKSSMEQTQIRKNNGQTRVIDEIGGKRTRSNTELFIQDDYFISDKLEILPGLRYQNDSDFGSYSAPKINIMYTPEWSQNFDTKLRFGIGRGYRVPTLKDRYYVFDHSANGYMVLGTPDLEPETSTSLNTGIEITKGNKFSVDLNLFHNDMKQLISTEIDAAESAATGLSIFKYTNVDKARTQGFDISAAYSFTPRLQGNVSYNYLDAIDKKTRKNLTRRPEHQVKLKLNYQFPQYKTDISLYGNYQSKEYVDATNKQSSPAYSTFDLKINKQIRKGTKVFFGIDNITDTHKDVPATGTDFRPDNGRFIYTGIRFSG